MAQSYVAHRKDFWTLVQWEGKPRETCGRQAGNDLTYWCFEIDNFQTAASRLPGRFCKRSYGMGVVTTELVRNGHF